MANTNGFSPFQVQLPEDLYSSSSSGGKSPVRDSSSPNEIGPALPWKPCRYFARGYCPYGSKCWFWHGPVSQSSGSSSSATSQREMRGQEGIASASLERLEMELHDLLREIAPVTITFLPQCYQEMFGKVLQADGYLTVSQRHGESGYGLKKLLSRMEKTVTLIEFKGWQGKITVMLAKEALERDALGGEKPGSRMIYIAFPAESAFTEEDVMSYFSHYGPVRNVNIPFRRLFGFVNFVSSETVKTILLRSNLHKICGTRVYVNRYQALKREVRRPHPEAKVTSAAAQAGA